MDGCASQDLTLYRPPNEDMVIISCLSTFYQHKGTDFSALKVIQYTAWYSPVSQTHRAPWTGRSRHVTEILLAIDTGK